MAFSCLSHYFKYSYYLRPSRYFMNVQKCLEFSTSKKISAKNYTPVKYTTSKGAELSIEETIYYRSNKRKYAPKYEKLIIVASTAVFLIYFCAIREENDLDEILKGNSEYIKHKNVELINLKLKLIYCEQNNLPTNAIKAKIEEIEMSNLIKSSVSK